MEDGDCDLHFRPYPAGTLPTRQVTYPGHRSARAYRTKVHFPGQTSPVLSQGAQQTWHLTPQPGAITRAWSTHSPPSPIQAPDSPGTFRMVKIATKSSARPGCCPGTQRALAGETAKSPADEDREKAVNGSIRVSPGDPTVSSTK